MFVLAFQTISIYFHVFCIGPHERVSKMKLFHNLCRFKRKREREREREGGGFLFIHKTGKVLYPIDDAILKRAKELVKTVLVILSEIVLF